MSSHSQPSEVHRERRTSERLPSSIVHRPPSILHPFAWVAWLVAALGLLVTTRNPLYLVLILLCIAIVRAATAAPAGEAWSPPLSVWLFGAIIVPPSALFNALSNHVGDTVLFRLPAQIPLFGGPITLEALVFGALNGLVLTGLFAAFSVLNVALPMRALVRLIPRAFHPVAVVVVVALTFVPFTLRHFQQIREAQAVRGLRVRGLRDWVPLFMPLLIGGMERGLGLAEAMTARGFAATNEPMPTLHRATLVAGLALVLGGWLWELGWGADAGYALMLLGVALVAGILWRMGRRAPHTLYRHEPWRARDWAMVAAAIVVLFPLFLPVAARLSLYYYPYPALTAPLFDPAIALSMLALLAPALLNTRPSANSASSI